jgi:hydrogenase-1 operon protein HyaF
MTDFPLVWHPKVPAPAPAHGEDSLRLLDMPLGQVPPRRNAKPVDHLSPVARAALEEALAALHRHAAGEREPSRISLRGLEADDRDMVLDVLGEGDVWAQVGGNVAYEIAESVLAGLWRIEATAQDGTKSEWLEVADIPQAISATAERMPRESIAIPTQVPQGAMNALALLTELQQRSAGYQPGAENHIINFTLLPITEVDAEVLTTVLGQLPLVIRGGGYGSCRIFATGLRHVWAVQYLNSMGTVILDTLEIGGVPVAALAAREDFEDSAERLGEMIKAYAT